MNGVTIVAPSAERVADTRCTQAHFGRKQLGHVDREQQRHQHIDGDHQQQADDRQHDGLLTNG